MTPIIFSTTSRQGPTGVTGATVASVLALSISAVLSYRGLSLSMDMMGLAGGIAIGLSLVIALLFSSLIHVMGRRAGYLRGSRNFRYVLHARPPGSVALAGAFCLAMMLASMATTFSAMVFTSATSSVQSRIDVQATATVKAPLVSMAKNDATVAALFAQLSATAKAQSVAERKYGGTCGPTGSGEGPITTLREDHAHQLAGLSTTAEGWSRAATTILSGLTGSLTQGIVDQAYLDARALRLSPERSRVMADLQVLRTGYAGGGFQQGGRTRRCNDPAMVSGLDTLIEALERPVNLPPDAPQLRAANLLDAYGLIGQAGKAGGIPLGSTVVFLLISILVDTVGAAAAFRAGHVQGGLLSAEEKQELHRHDWILSNYLWRFRSPKRKQVGADGKDGPGQPLEEAVFLVPFGGDGDKNDDARKMAAAFGLQPDVERAHVPLNSFHPELKEQVQQFRLATGGATHVAFYPIRDQHTYDRMEWYKQLCTLALFSDRVQSETYGDVGDKNWLIRQADRLRKQAEQSNIRPLFP